MKSVFITGAAGGVGLALAKSFAARGYQLVLTDRNAEALAATAAELNAPTEQIVADLRDPAALQQLSARLERTDAPVDVLVNNAGIIVPGPVGTLDDDVMRAHVPLRAP